MTVDGGGHDPGCLTQSTQKDSASSGKCTQKHLPLHPQFNRTIVSREVLRVLQVLALTASGTR